LARKSPASIPADRPLLELGLDSLMAVQLRNRLASATGLPLPVTLLFDHPTPSALTALFRKRILQGEVRVDQQVHSEVERLEVALSTMYENEALRPRLTERLQALLSRWTDPGDTPVDSDLATKLRSATDKELFKLFDRDFSSRGDR
uniref:acyl carrier protein n=1 Tax=Anaeromyxobacter oryzisoli TaxID=2925408 RepID=UPI001F59E28D